MNPADVYRLLNLTGTASVSGFAGVGRLGGSMGLGAPGLAGVLAAWMLVPLAASIALFARRQI
jgi:Cu-processing system permease protein